MGRMSSEIKKQEGAGIEIMPGPQKKCGKCELYMRRVYVQQGETIEGKRTNKMIPIGRVCLNCKTMEFD